MMGGCNTRNMYREELSEIKYLRLLHQVGVFIYRKQASSFVTVEEWPSTHASYSGISDLDPGSAEN